MTAPVGPRRGRVLRDSASLLVGTLINGVFAYIFFAQATRGLGAVAAAPVAVLWTYWGVATAVITFPVQHWIIRTMRADGEEAVAAALPRMSLSVVGFAAAATMLSWLVDDQLFVESGFAFPLLVGLLTIGTFFAGVVRGGLAGRDRFGATALALAADNVSRVLLAAIVLQVGGGAVAIGVVLVVGAFVGLAWPSGYRFHRAHDTGADSSSLTFVGAVAASSLLGQLILVGGPAVLPFLGGAPREITVLFATLAFFRAPYLLGVGIANRVTGSLTSWVRANDRRRVRMFQGAVAVATIVTAAAAGVVSSVIGPVLVGAVFGRETVPPTGVAGIVAAGSAFAVGNLALSLLAIAQARGGRLARAWIMAAVAVVIVLIVSPGAPMTVVAWAFLIGEGTAFAFLLWRGWRASPAVGAGPGVAATQTTDLDAVV